MQKQKKLSDNSRKSNGRLIDETGNKYGMLTVIEYAGSGRDSKYNGNDGGAAWKCRCDCGKETIALGVRLRNGVHKSCGNHWIKAKGEGAFNAMYKVRTFAAKRRGIEWHLTKDQVKEISGKPCSYCGKQPSNVCLTPTSNGEFVYSGIDRVDSEKGYIIENCIPSCSDCNKAKMTRSVDEFREWFKRVALFNGWKCDLDSIDFKMVGER